MQDKARGLIFAAQLVAVYACASYLNVALFVLVWTWAAARGRLSGRGPGLLREGLELSVFASLVVHMYTSGMLGRPVLFVRKPGSLECRVSAVESTEAMLARENASACGLHGYAAVPARATYDLRAADERVFLSTRDGTGGETLRTCAQLGVSCFQWRVAGRDGVPPHTPAVAMLERVLVHDASALYLAASYTQHRERALHAHRLPAADGNSSFVLHSPLRERVPLRYTGVRGVLEVAALDAEISGDDTFVLVHAHERDAGALGVRMLVAFSRFCTHDPDVCDGSVYANTNQFFRLAQVTTPHPFSLFATVSACAHPMYTNCGYSFAGGAVYLVVNELLALSCLLVLAKEKPRWGYVYLLLQFVCMFSANWAGLLALCVPPHLVRPVHAYSAGVSAVLLAQFAYGLYLLADLGFGVDERYVTERAAHANYLELLLLPCSYFAGSVYVQGLLFTVLSATALLANALTHAPRAQPYAPVCVAEPEPANVHLFGGDRARVLSPSPRPGPRAHVRVPRSDVGNVF